MHAPENAHSHFEWKKMDDIHPMRYLTQFYPPSPEVGPKMGFEAQVRKRAGLCCSFWVFKSGTLPTPKTPPLSGCTFLRELVFVLLSSKTTGNSPILGLELPPSSRACPRSRSAARSSWAGEEFSVGSAPVSRSGKNGHDLIRWT